MIPVWMIRTTERDVTQHEFCLLGKDGHVVLVVKDEDAKQKYVDVLIHERS